MPAFARKERDRVSDHQDRSRGCLDERSDWQSGISLFLVRLM